MPICKTCKQDKDATEFYVYKKRGGLLFTDCKTCWKAKVNARHRSLDPEEARAKWRARRKLPHTIASTARYFASEKGKATRERTLKKYYAQHPTKIAARVILNNAIKLGKVVKPHACIECGTVRRLEGHHHDYTKPLDVEWLCIPCHSKRHWGEQGEDSAPRGA